ncbi:MAG: hypothetical protein HY238_22660 [Acidobacteria bacterium]|nr:hypothetical protein [Acidobacteriota bacterium]
MKTPLMVCAVLAFSASASGQAVVEYGLNAGRASVAGAAANKTGKATGAALDKVGGALNNAGGKTSAAKPAVAQAQAAQAQAAAPAKPPETEKAASAASENTAVDVAALSSGLERDELLKKFGKPSMKLTNTDGPDLVEKYFYKSAGGEKVVVTLRNGKVVLP